jgi:hypothetical protein
VSTPDDKPTVARDERGHWLPGRSGNPGGKPKKLREIEEMLDAEHRTVDNMREVYRRLKELAIDDVVRVFMDRTGNVHESHEPPDPAFMKIYLERIMGPVKDVSDERLEKMLTERLEQMLAEAEARRSMQ